MLMRQTMGGRLSNYDIYLVTAYVSQGFVLAFCAIIPSVVADFVHISATSWGIASGLAAVILGTSRVYLQRLRTKTGNHTLPPFLIAVYAFQWVFVALLAANAVIPALRFAGPFKASPTLSLAVVMLAFVRRIASLLGDQPSADWDPQRA